MIYAAPPVSPLPGLEALTVSTKNANSLLSPSTGERILYTAPCGTIELTPTFFLPSLYCVVSAEPVYSQVPPPCTLLSVAVAVVGILNLRTQRVAQGLIAAF